MVRYSQCLLYLRLSSSSQFTLVIYLSKSARKFILHGLVRVNLFKSDGRYCCYWNLGFKSLLDGMVNIGLDRMNIIKLIETIIKPHCWDISWNCSFDDGYEVCSDCCWFALTQISVDWWEVNHWCFISRYHRWII